MLKLNNDEAYARLIDMAKMEPVVEIIHKVPEEYAMRITWHVEMAYAHFFNRDYKSAEAEMRKAIGFDEHHAALQSQLAGLVGRQGRYKEALEVAEKSVDYARESAELGGEWSELFTFRTAVCRAIWLAASGKKDEAQELFATVRKPETDGFLTDYYAICCEYYAVSKQPEKLAECMVDALHNDFVEPEKYPFGFNRATFERDVVYDPYRGEKWFADKVGPTLLTTR